MSKYRFDQIAINSTAKKKPAEEDKYHYIGLEHLDSQSLVVSRWGSEIVPTGEKLLMKKGDVLFGKRRAYQKKVAIAPFDGIFSAHGMVLRPNEKNIDKDFFPMFLSSDYFLDTAIAISVGSLSPTINWKDLARLEFELPSLAEQRKLAEVLWAINDTLQAYQNLLAETDALVQAQFIEMFGNSSCPMQRLDFVAEVKSGLTKNSRRVSFSMKLPYLRVANVLFNKLDLSDIQEIGVEEREVKKTLLQKNDLLIVEGNGSSDQIGRVALWDGSISPIVHQNHIIRVRLNTHEILPDFAMYYYMTHEGRQQILWSASTTSGLYTLSLDKVSKLKVPVPPIHEQQSFVAFAQQSANSKVALQNAITSLRATKRSILENALGTGRKE